MRPAPTRSSSTTPSGSLMAPTSRSREFAPGRSRRSSSTRTRCSRSSRSTSRRAAFGAFHADAFCQSRPQSLIGEYFIDCQPGQRGAVLQPGSTIPVTRTQSTIPADLLLNVLRLPYRQRMALIINELGAAAAGRSGDIEAALRRAVPAINETDNLLDLRPTISRTWQRLTVSADTLNDRRYEATADQAAAVIVRRRNNTATVAAGHMRTCRGHRCDCSGSSAQLSAAMKQLGAAAAANIPVAANLNSAASQLHHLFDDLPAFSTSSSCRRSSPRQRRQSRARRPCRQPAATVQAVNQFAKPTPRAVAEPGDPPPRPR